MPAMLLAAVPIAAMDRSYEAAENLSPDEIRPRADSVRLSYLFSCYY